MKDYIARNSEWVLANGPLVLIGAIVLCLWGIYAMVRNRRFYLPNSILGWLGTLSCLFMIFIFSMAIVGLRYENQTTGKVLKQISTMVDAKAPELTFSHVANEGQGKLADYEGKVVILNFWATWCAPCIREMPELIQLQEDYRSKGLEVVLLSDESRERLLQFDKINMDAINSVYNEQIEWLEINIGTARPLSLVIDRQGTIRGYFTGVHDYKFFESIIQPHL